MNASRTGLPIWARVLRVWLPIAVAVTGLVALTNVAVQQGYRMSANDPQIQLAQDAATSLVRRVPVPSSVVPSGNVDIATSLAPFVIVYDGNGQPLAGNGTLNGKLPKPPEGVLFAAAGKSDGNAVTWQPRPGVRIASVTFEANTKGRAGGPMGPFYVLSGRSLREVEIREANNNKIAFAAWLATLLATLVTVIAAEFAVDAVTPQAAPDKTGAR